MERGALTWFLITLLCIFAQGLYSMLEMAAVSFNRLRLEYYVSKGMRRATWLHYLLQKPSRLFGTVMLGVNVALQIGSQSSREFYRALNLNPDIAPLTQILLVVIFAELAPLFAARRYAEHVILLGVPILYATHRLLSPLIWIISSIARGFMHLVQGGRTDVDLFMSRDELQKILESHEETPDELNLVVANIFTLRTKTAGQVMTPLSEVNTIRSNTTVGRLREKMGEAPKPFIPLFHKHPANIVALAFTRDLVRHPDNRSLRDASRPPWFITQESKLLDILHQFRRNNQDVALVLNREGRAVGMLTLDAIFEEIFGEHEDGILIETQKPVAPLIERTLPGNTTISDFNRDYGASLQGKGSETLAQLMVSLLDHPPSVGESVVLEPFLFTVEEAGLLGIKMISVKSLES